MYQTQTRCGPPKNRVLGPLEKTDTKFRTSVKQKTNPISCRLNMHNKYIKAGQKCISASENCLQRQANELCMLDVESKCE